MRGTFVSNFSIRESEIFLVLSRCYSQFIYVLFVSRKRAGKGYRGHMPAEVTEVSKNALHTHHEGVIKVGLVNEI